MKFPINDVLCIIIGYLSSALLMYSFSVVIKKYNLSLSRLLKLFPNWLAGLILIPLLLIMPLFLVWMFIWAFHAYDYMVDGDIKNAILVVLSNIFGCFYSAFITKDMPKRYRRH